MAEPLNETITVEEWGLNSIAVTLNDYRVEGSGDAHELLRLTLVSQHKERTGAAGHVQNDGTDEVSGEAIITLKGGAPALLEMREWLLRGVTANSPPYQGTIRRPDGSQLLLRSGMLMGQPQDWERPRYESFLFVFGLIKELAT